MTATEIKKALTAAPFQPFQLVTGAGERFQVPTPDHAAVSPTGRIVAVFHDDEGTSLLDIFLITSLYQLPPGARRRRPKRKR